MVALYGLPKSCQQLFSSFLVLFSCTGSGRMAPFLSLAEATSSAAHLRAGSGRVGARLAGPAQPARRSAGRVGPGPGPDRRPHDRLPQRLFAALQGGDCVRRQSPGKLDGPGCGNATLRVSYWARCWSGASCRGVLRRPSRSRGTTTVSLPLLMKLLWSQAPPASTSSVSNSTVVGVV